MARPSKGNVVLRPGGQQHRWQIALQQQPAGRGLGYFPDQSRHPAHLRCLRSSGHTKIDRKSLQTGKQGR